MDMETFLLGTRCYNF